MFRAPVLLFALLAIPAQAQDQPSDPGAADLAIAASVQQQLMACWSVPPGEENQRMAIDIAFFGDGRLEGQVALGDDDVKRASKHGAFAQSVLRAVASCAPFEGLEALGAGPDERFSVTINFQS